MVRASGDNEQVLGLLVVHQHTLRPHGGGAYHPTPHPYGSLRERCWWLSILHESKSTWTCRPRNYRVLIVWFSRHPTGSRSGQRGAVIQTQMFERTMLCFSRRWCDCDYIWTRIRVTTPDTLLIDTSCNPSICKLFSTSYQQPLKPHGLTWRVYNPHGKTPRHLELGQEPIASICFFLGIVTLACTLVIFLRSLICNHRRRDRRLKTLREHQETMKTILKQEFEKLNTGASSAEKVQ